MHNLVICLTFFVEMFISYNFFSYIGERKLSPIKCMLIGTALFLSGAVFDIMFSNTFWFNVVYSISCNAVFSYLCFDISKAKILFYSVILVVFSVCMEFGAIFIISSITETEVNAYQTNVSFYIIDATLCKALYFLICQITVRFIKKEKETIRIPITFYMYPVSVVTILIVFWSICTTYDISYKYQIVLAIISFVLFILTVLLFISYQHSIEKENLILALQTQVEKQNTDANYYAILEKQNRDLRVYAHDTKNHLNAIHSLNSNPEIDEYLDMMIDELKTYSSVCHSGNHMLDVIINKYVTECKIKGVDFSFDVHLANLGYVKNSDLVTILGNALDNALESAEKSKKKVITIATDHINTYDVITITNSCDEAPKSKGSELYTTKSNTEFHGLGVKSIKKTIRNYSGDLEWNYDTELNEFTLIISLLNK